MIVNHQKNVIIIETWRPNPGVISVKINVIPTQVLRVEILTQELLNTIKIRRISTSKITNMQIVINEIHVNKSCLEINGSFKSPEVIKNRSNIWVHNIKPQHKLDSIKIFT